MSGGGKGGEQSSTTTVEIPGFLKPFLRQSVDVGQGALGELEGLIQPGTSLVSPFNQTQRDALRGAEAVGRGAGGFIPTAQQTLLDTAQGDFLFGGEGFDAAVNAATRAAQPGILSSFGRAGRGVSGLGQAAVGQAATDAFASQFGQERGRQLAAAQALPDIGLAGTNILSQVGSQRQAQSQQEELGPVLAMERLLQSALGVTPSQQGLLQGRTQTVSGGGGSKAGDILGTAASVAGLGLGGDVSLLGGLLSGKI